ncbi:uncharacterized protein [Gossypium hirsutum]|uniref:Tf2-1-like SH3-like domain-containing protein n=1 Tax=Gossypium hirsutum TaxID=3635 RepID=A0A1U8IE53_GOSHI|nr:uncharacterized protein LOC107895758 [Gossypium hirsutum]
MGRKSLFALRMMNTWLTLSENKNKVRLIRDCLKVASDRRKSYADLKRKDIEYSVGDYLFFKILKCVGSVAYQLQQPLELDCIHDVFHVLMLRRYQSDPSHVVSAEEIEIRPNLTFEEELV